MLSVHCTPLAQSTCPVVGRGHLAVCEVLEGGHLRVAGRPGSARGLILRRGQGLRRLCRPLKVPSDTKLEMLVCTQPHTWRVRPARLSAHPAMSGWHAAVHADAVCGSLARPG